VVLALRWWALAIAFSGTALAVLALADLAELLSARRREIRRLERMLR
jgi:hypothetical protein